MRRPYKGAEAPTVALLLVAVILVTQGDASVVSSSLRANNAQPTLTKATSIHIDKNEVEAVQFGPSDPNNQAPANARPLMIKSNQSWPTLPREFGNRSFVINIPKVDIAEEAIGINGCLTCLQEGAPVPEKQQGSKPSSSNSKLLTKPIKPFYLVPEPPRKIRKKIQKKIKKKYKKQRKKAKKKIKKLKKKIEKKKAKKKPKKKPKSNFYVKIHFEHGRKKYRMFDYATAGKGAEYKSFPDQFVKLIKKKKMKKKFEKGITLYVAGMHSEEGIEKRNSKLAIKRATSAACYVAWYLIRTHKFKNVKLMVGIFKKDPDAGKKGKEVKKKEGKKAKEKSDKKGKGSKTNKSKKPALFELQSRVMSAKKKSKRKSSKQHKKQRRVNIFLPSHKDKKHFKFEFKWGWGKYKSKHKSRGDGGLAKTCFKRKARKNWQVKRFKRFWLNYRRP